MHGALTIPISLQQHALLALSGKRITHCSPLLQQPCSRVYICLMNAATAIIAQIYGRLNHRAKQKAIMSSDTEELTLAECKCRRISVRRIDHKGNYSSTPIKAVRRSVFCVKTLTSICAHIRVSTVYYSYYSFKLQSTIEFL